MVLERDHTLGLVQVVGLLPWALVHRDRRVQRAGSLGQALVDLEERRRLVVGLWRTLLVVVVVVVVVVVGVG